MTNLSFQPIFHSYTIVALLAGVLIALLWVQPMFPSAQPGRRRLLTLLRSIVIALLTLAMLRPTVTWSDADQTKPAIVLAIDGSRSMNIPDVNNGSRWQALKQTLATVSDRITRLAETHEVRQYVFDKRGKPQPAAQPLPELATGDESDLAAALDDILRGESGKRLGGVILMSDGANRATQPRGDMQLSAREMARRGIPLITVPFGQSRDQSQIRDVAVINLPDQFTVFLNNELQVQSTLRIQGYAARAIPVEMELVAPDGTQQTVGPIMAEADQSDQETRITMDFAPDQVGQYRLTIRATPQPGEQVQENNELTAFVTVLDGGLRVLYVDGNIGWQERKFIRRSLDESPDVQVDVWLDSRQAGAPPLSLPSDMEKTYDVFLLGDIDAASLGMQNMAKLVSAVADGKGLIMHGGLRSFGPGGYAESPLAALLPVTLDRLELQSEGGAIRADVHITDEVTMKPTIDHFTTRLDGRAGNQALWRELPPLLGANRFRGLGPQSIVLAESNDGQPLLVAGQFGLGRVLAFAGDSTYRWYRSGFQREHKRFWRQIILWLARKDQAQKDDVWIRMAQRRFTPGLVAPFSVGVNDAAGSPIPDATIEVELVDPQGERQNVRPTRLAEEWTGESPLLELPGDYRLEVVATANGKEIGRATGSFTVLDQDLELADPAANPRQLAALSEFTASVGGKMVAAEDLDAALRELAERSIDSEVTSQSRWQFADTTLDASVFFACIFGLLVLEWFLRKRWGLV